jgi:hypothetical protein
MGRCDQGIKFCSIFKVLGMRRKQCHCVHLVFLIPAVYLLSQTESVWRRYRDLFTKPNRQNFWMLTVPVRTVQYGDVAGPYRPYGDDVAVVYCLVAGESGGDTCPVGGK